MSLILFPLSLRIKLRASIISHPFPSLTHCLYLRIPSLIPFNKTKIISLFPLTIYVYLFILFLIPANTSKTIHYLLPLLSYHPLSSNSISYPFQYNYLFTYVPFQFLTLICIFSFTPLSFSTQLRQSIYHASDFHVSPFKFN